MKRPLESLTLEWPDWQRVRASHGRLVAYFVVHCPPDLLMHYAVGVPRDGVIRCRCGLDIPAAYTRMVPVDDQSCSMCWGCQLGLDGGVEAGGGAELVELLRKRGRA